jgi:hypothetical protein
MFRLPIPHAALASLALAALLPGCVAPPYMAQVEAAQRRYEQQRRQADEVERLMRLGRFDEAEQLAQSLEASIGRQLDEAKLPRALGSLELPSLGASIGLSR